MKLFFTRPVWIRALLIALTFTLCAVSVRVFFGYPRCQNDELNWIHIAHSLDKGVDWPVSGPSFMYVLRELKSLTQMQYAHLISGMGIFSVFVGTLLIILGYSRLRITRPGVILVALSLSSYFWVPLLEARPQQWGQIQVFIGSIAVWLWLHKRGGWLFFPVLILASVSHILSHAILVFMCATLALADYFENRPLTRRHAIVIACVLLSLGIYLLPSGPYQTMLRDIEQIHLRKLLVVAPYLGAAALAMIFALLTLQPRLHWRPDWSHATARYALTHQRRISILVLAIFFVAMAIQASVLPAASWLPYGGSIWTFFIFQTGNLLFALLFIHGLFAFLRAVSDQAIDLSHARMLVWSLIAFAALGAITLIASFWMHDSNWVLRLINYCILFAAPIAALGLEQFQVLKRRPLLYLLILPFIFVSIGQAVRPIGYLGC